MFAISMTYTLPSTVQYCIGCLNHPDNTRLYSSSILIFHSSGFFSCFPEVGKNLKLLETEPNLGSPISVSAMGLFGSEY